MLSLASPFDQVRRWCLDAIIIIFNMDKNFALLFPTGVLAALSREIGELTFNRNMYMIYITPSCILLSDLKEARSLGLSVNQCSSFDASCALSVGVGFGLLLLRAWGGPEE